MILGCDGGFYVTYDRGRNWDHLNHPGPRPVLPRRGGQQEAVLVYGGLQDNGSWGGPSAPCAAAPARSTRTGCLDQRRRRLRLPGRSQRPGPGLRREPERRHGTAEPADRRARRPSARRPSPGERCRFNWNTPFILSHHNPQHLLLCGQVRLPVAQPRGTTCGRSPRRSPGRARAAARPSPRAPRNPDVLWAGTDDGNLWVTRDGGGKWDQRARQAEGRRAAGSRVGGDHRAVAARRGPGYVCLDAHRSDDDKPYLFVTEDFGETWKPITANLPEFGSTRCLREDITNPDLLYCGTEFGIWVSLNRGKAWTKLNNNLPTVAVHEVASRPHGRRDRGRHARPQRLGAGRDQPAADGPVPPCTR
jgi:hypothetical protein